LTLQVHLSETRSESDAARQRFGTSATARCHARGGNVALGTDGSANSDNQNLFGPLLLAAILPRAPELDARRWPSTRDVLEMVTANGARKRFDEPIGSIAPMAKADLVLMDLRASYFHPFNDLVNLTMYAEVGSSVRMVFVDGRRVLEEGRVTTRDEAALFAEADDIGQHIIRDLAASGR
jgi:cytosine/adenosine deaminase-related metal-dependent hydrolase